MGSADVRGLALGVMLLAASVVGCGGSKPVVLRAEARSPISESTSALSPQAREVPWAGQTLRATAPFPLKATEGLDTPMAAAEARVLARQQALTDLARQLSRLPAAEPPPGESVQSNVGDFARRQPQFAVAIEAELLKAEETVRLVPAEAQGQVEVSLPLKSIAEELLRSGGGYRKGDKTAEAIGPRGIAARRATEEAEEKLLREALATRISDTMTVQEWVLSEPGNRQLLVETVQKKKTLVGEARPTADDPAAEEFVVELELDMTPVLEAARGQEKARQRTRERNEP